VVRATPRDVQMSLSAMVLKVKRIKKELIKRMAIKLKKK
jgi:hypothetical protein